MALCDHLLEAETCADCNPRPGITVSPPPGYGPWFEARHWSLCPGCETTVRPGDMIRADGCGEYLCSHCGASGPGVSTVRVSGNML
jgi:hypothetical protein